MIEQVLNVLERMTRKAEATGAIEKEPARDAVDFFRMFADKCHHGKEEAQLFPAMEAKGFPRNGGPTGVMMQEHDQGRACVRGMAEAIEKDNVPSFVRNGRSFIELLRQHIQKEDHCLFSMADQAFNADDQAKLLAAFETVERDHMGAGTHEKYLKIANDLADRYGVTRVAQAETEHACCCHH